MQEKESHQTFIIRAYTKKELRLLYEIPEASFRRWLKEIPETSDTGRKNYLTAIQVEAVLKTYGIPAQKQYKKTTY